VQQYRGLVGDGAAEEADGPDATAPEAEVEGPPGPSAAYAINWKTVLAVDAAMGVIVALGGVVAMVAWNFALGVFLAGLGLFYVAMVLRRGRRWQELRRQAGC
jgi:hypothetical protein